MPEPEHPTAAPSAWRELRGYPLRAFFICLVGGTLANMDQALFGFLLTDLKEAFGWSDVERGWYIAITFALAGAAIVWLGTLTDRLGRKTVFQGSILVSSILVTALKWVPNTLSLLVVRTLGFASGGIQSPVTGTIIVEESPPRLRGLTSGVLQITYPLGWAVASLLTAWVYSRYGWRNVFLIGLLSIPYLFIVRRYLRETRAFVKAREHRERTGADRPRIRELFTPALRTKTIALFWGEFLHVFAYGSTILLTSYFREARGWEATDAIQLVGLSYLVGSVGYVLAAVVGEFVITRRNTIIVWSWLGSVAFAVMIWKTESFVPTAIAFCFMTVFFYGTTAVKFTFIAESFPARLRATGVTFAGSLAVNLGIAFGPLALSYCVPWLGWEGAYTLCGILPIFASSLFFLALKPIPRGAAVDE